MGQKTIKKNAFLKCILTDDEILQTSRENAQAVQRHNELENDKKTVADQFKADLQSLEATIQRKSALINAGYEHRDVQCEEIHDYEAKTVTLVRLDMDEVVSTRAMREDELQMELGGEDGEAVDEGEDAVDANLMPTDKDIKRFAKLSGKEKWWLDHEWATNVLQAQKAGYYAHIQGAKLKDNPWVDETADDYGASWAFGWREAKSALKAKEDAA